MCAAISFSVVADAGELSLFARRRFKRLSQRQCELRRSASEFGVFSDQRRAQGARYQQKSRVVSLHTKVRRGIQCIAVGNLMQTSA